MNGVASSVYSPCHFVGYFRVLSMIFPCSEREVRVCVELRTVEERKERDGALEGAGPPCRHAGPPSFRPGGELAEETEIGVRLLGFDDA